MTRKSCYITKPKQVTRIPCLTASPLKRLSLGSHGWPLIPPFTQACSAGSLCSVGSPSLLLPQVLFTRCSLSQYILHPDSCRAHSLTFFRPCISLTFSVRVSLISLIMTFPPNSTCYFFVVLLNFSVAFITI